jgi:hypothetical protein
MQELADELAARGQTKMDKRLQLSFQKKNVVHFSIKYDI